MDQSNPNEPTDEDLQRPIMELGDEAYQILGNEARKRVFRVLDNLIDVRGRATKGKLEGNEVQCILFGAIGGIACLVARMDLKGTGESDQEPEILLLNDLGNQFLAVVEHMRENDPIAKAMYATRLAGGIAS